jgi:uncharacterized protein (TIGR02145 family)
MKRYSRQIEFCLRAMIDRLRAHSKPKLREYSVPFFVFILTASLLLFPSVAITDCTWSSLIGDVDGNEQITPGDALEIFWSSINGNWITMDNYCCLDANRDETVTPGDALMVFWYSIYGGPVEGVTGHVGEPCEINTAPIASFTVDPASGTTDTVFDVDASASTDNEDPTSVLQVRWDWENDGTYDTGWTTTKTASHQYSTAGTKTIKLEVKDTGGLTDTETKQVTISPPCATVTDIDGNVYCIVTIGSQVWMAENLKVTHYRNGDAISNVTDNSEWGDLTTGAYSEYNNDVNNAATYGRLYNWYAVDDGRNIAPAGWHVPTDDDWKELEMYLGMSQSQADLTGWRGTDEGGQMKEAGTSHWISPNTGATNSSDFTALPGGFRNVNGSFNNLVYSAYFWSSTENDSSSAWSRLLDFYYSEVYRYNNNMQYGCSVRCIRDN